MNILNIISKYPDFQINGDKVIQSEQLEIFINRIVKAIIAENTNNLKNSLQNKHKEEMDKSEKTESFSSWVFIGFCGDIYNYLIETNEITEHSECVSKLCHNIISHYRAFFTLWISNQENTSFALLRTMYELYIILRFIETYPDIVDSFNDHVYMKDAMIKKRIDPNYIMNEAEKSILNRYGNSFREDYGWTEKILKEKHKRNLKGMAEQLNLDEYKPLYVLTSETLHASSLSVNTYFTLLKDKELFRKSSIEILINSILSMLRSFKTDRKQYIVLMNIFYALCEDLLDAQQ